MGRLLRYLHPFAPAAHHVAEHEEEDESHGGGNGQRDQEVGEIISGLQGLRRRVVFSELGQDAGAWFRPGDVDWDHFVDVNLKTERSHLPFFESSKTLCIFILEVAHFI